MSQDLDLPFVIRNAMHWVQAAIDSGELADFEVVDAERCLKELPEWYRALPVVDIDQAAAEVMAEGGGCG